MERFQDILLEAFEYEKYPSEDTCRDLAQRIQVPFASVSQWFVERGNFVEACTIPSDRLEMDIFVKALALSFHVHSRIPYETALSNALHILGMADVDAWDIIVTTAMIKAASGSDSNFHLSSFMKLLNAAQSLSLQGHM